MTPNHEAPRPLHPRAYLRGNQLLASNRRLTGVKSHPYLKTGGWGANHELLHQLVLILLVCLFVFEIVGCAGGIKSGTTTTGTGSGWQRNRKRQYRWQRHDNNDSGSANRRDGNRRKRASRNRLDGKHRRDELPREARHRERRALSRKSPRQPRQTSPTPP